MRCLYFGCWGAPGHHFWGPEGRGHGLPNSEVFALSNALDGNFAPRIGPSRRICWRAQAPTTEADRALGWELRESQECPQGQFLSHRYGKWSLIQWWDRTQGDTRPGCNSSLLIEGDQNAQQILAAGRVCFARVFENLKKAGVELVEVTAGASCNHD